MPTILLVGSQREMTHHVATQLRSQGWEVEATVGPEAGLRAIDRLPEVDAMVMGGPAALSARGRLMARLRAKNPFAPVVVPNSPTSIGDQLMAAFGGDFH